MLLLVVIISTTAFAQHTYILDKTTRFEKMGAEEGLSSDYTTCLHQDKYGFIWIGTAIGLNLYDGYEIKTFNADPRNPTSLFNNWIHNIYEEPNGTMWFCTAIGLSKYNRSSQTFTNYIPDKSNIHSENNYVRKVLQDGDHLWIDVKAGLYLFNINTGQFQSFAKDTVNPSNGIYGQSTQYIFIDDSGVLWVCSGTENGSLCLSKFDKETKTFQHFLHKPFDNKSFNGYQIRSMLEDKNGTIWAATWGGGLLEIVDKKKGKFKQYLHEENEPYKVNDWLYTVFEDSKGNIWTGGNGGFSLLNIKTNNFTDYEIPRLLSNYYWASSITEFNEDEDNVLWLSSGMGLFSFDPNKQILNHYIHDPNDNTSLSGSEIIDIICGQSRQIWIATESSGFNILKNFSNSFRSIKKNINEKNPLSGDHINKIFVDSKDNIWVGALHNAGLNRASISKSKIIEGFEHYIQTADPKSINGNMITAIYEDKNQTIWIGTHLGLNKYNPKTNDFLRFVNDPHDSTSITPNVVETIFEDSYGTFWIGTRKGLNIMDRENGKFIQFIPDENNPDAIKSNYIRSIFEDSYRELWFGGDYLERLNRNDSSFIHLTVDNTDIKSGYEIMIWDIVEGDSSNLWLTSLFGGVHILQRKDMTLTSLTTDDRFNTYSSTGIEKDNNGYIWVETSHALLKIDPKDYTVQSFDNNDGLNSSELIDRALYKDKDGWLYVGGRRGFTFFNPNSIKENKLIPPVYITALNVSGNQKYFDKPLFELENIELNYNENDFSFDFVALNYINSQKNQYAYRLEGYDKDWIYVGDKRTANYTNMNSGKYSFQVKASNNDGYWNEEGASLVVIIYPPFWKTWWAYSIYAFIFLGLLYLVRRNELKKINLRLELEIKQIRTNQLEELDIEKSKFFSNISHEFRTPLTLILGPLERLIAKSNNTNEKDQLNLIRRNARKLQNLINQLLSLSKIESGKMELKTQPENIVKLARIFLHSFHSMAEDKGIKLEFESDAEEYLIYVDILKFEKIANNLLSNAFKFTERGGKVKIGISTTPQNPLPMKKPDRFSRGETLDLPKEVTIKFSDTGIGIRKQKLPHVFDRFYQVDKQQMKTNLGTGIGLALTKELTELHHGTITVDSEFGMGTTFTISLLMGKDHLTNDEIFEPEQGISELGDELLNDDNFLTQDIVTKPELQTEVQANNNYPLLLIVEDNDDMRAYIKSYLTASYQILEASNGRDGAELAIEHIPDLIISDLMMPFVDGNEMTNQLKNDERTSHIPIILLTARSSTASKLEGLETGADDFLTKPFDANELLVRIKNLIDQRKKLSKLLSMHIGDVAQTRIIKESSGKAMSKLDEQFLGKTKGLIDEHMANPDFSVEMLAQKMTMSRVQLHRKLKGLTNHSSSDLIRDIRLTKAAELLKEGDLNITQISYEVGISSLSNLAKNFKEKYGVSPSDYAKNQFNT